MNLRLAFGKALQDTEMFPEKGARVLVACSGGADSVALLYLLSVWRQRFGFELGVVSVDHGLRADSGKDLTFVRNTAWSLGLPCWTGSVNVTADRRKNESIEMAARRLRHEVFRQVGKRVGATDIALGHHADDQAETMILRLCRGVGPRGVAGMRPVAVQSPLKPLRLLRPLLSFTSSELRCFLTTHGIPWIEDESNQDPEHRRNRVRHRILPQLKQELNPATARHLCHTAALLREDDDFLSRLAATESAKMISPGRGLNLTLWRKLDPAIARRVLIGFIGGEFAEEADRWFSDMFHRVEGGRQWNVGRLRLQEKAGRLIRT